MTVNQRIVLPTPAAPFEWAEAGAGAVLVCRALEPFAAHLFTTRSWPLGLAPSSDDSRAPWDDVARALDVDPDRLARVGQIHGAGVAIAGTPAPHDKDADIILSDDAQFAVAIRTADCVPLLIADRRSGAVAAAHAGWRGLAARVPHVTVASLEQVFGCRRGDLVAAIGPSIGACCYEVGSSVRESFERAGFGAGDLADWFLDRPSRSARNPSMPGLGAPRDDHWFFDAWSAARQQLVAAGVPSSQVFVAETCTASHEEAFCSYRRDGVGAGRLGCAIRSGSRRPWPRSPGDPRAS